MRHLRRTIALLALAAAPLVAPIAAHAAPAEQVCDWNAFRQHDMAGIYVSGASMMRVEIYPCGGSFVQWTNAYGVHGAAYYGVKRVPGGGIVAAKAPNSYESLDATGAIGFKPGIPGTIEVFTADAYGNLLGVYTLQKIS